MSNCFFKLYDDMIFAKDDEKLSVIEKEFQELEKNGGMYLYKLIYKKRVRDKWRDSSGYPIKREFQKKHYLARTVSIRKLCKETGFANEKVQKLLNSLIRIGIIIKTKSKMLQNQNTYTVGTWAKTLTSEKNKLIYEEYLYLHKVLLNNNNNTTTKNTINLDNLDFSEMDMYMEF